MQIGHKTKRRILIVDDNVDAAVITAELLRVLGNEVEVVHDGEAGIKATFSQQPEIVLLDICLPRFDGYEVARQIRGNANITQPILIALSGWGDDNVKHAAADSGFDYHLVKPIDLERLIGAISGAANPA